MCPLGLVHRLQQRQVCGLDSGVPCFTFELNLGGTPCILKCLVVWKLWCIVLLLFFLFFFGGGYIADCTVAVYL